MKHATIIPLIGGETLGSEQAFGTRPDYFLSFDGFWQNDRHIVNHYNNEVPYYNLSKNEKPPHKVDIIGSVCPCAGLSFMHHNYGDANENNKWLIETTKYVLTDLRPEVLWGENSPHFAGKVGQNIRNTMYKIGRDNGYSMSIYRTKSLLHGVPQVRERAFYFFWKGNKTPVFDYYDRQYTPIEEVILNARGNTLQIPINKKTPSEDLYYKYILEDIHGGITHREFASQIEPSSARGNDAFSYLEKQGRNYYQVAEWMKARGHDKEVEKCISKQKKLDSGGNIMRRGVIVPKDFIGAFVGHYPMMLTHPVEDKFITFREALTIMGHPDDFELLDPQKSYNHICQNVPVPTARDMAHEIKSSLNGDRYWIDSTLTFQYNGTKRIEMRDQQINNIENFFS